MYRKPPRGQIEKELQRCALDTDTSVPTVRAVWMREEDHTTSKPRRRIHAWLKTNGYGRDHGRPEFQTTPLYESLKTVAAILREAS